MKKLLLYYCLFFTISSNAQIYFCTDESVVSTGTLNLEECTFQFNQCGPIVDQKGDRVRFGDIALHPDGRLFGTIGSNNVYYIVEIDYKNCRLLDTLIRVPHIGATSLVINKDGAFYTGFLRIYKYELEENTIVLLGSAPTGGLTGDLIFYDNQLYGSAAYQISADSIFSSLYQIGLIDGSNGDENPKVMDLEDGLLIKGLTTQWESDCSKKKIIGDYSYSFLSERSEEYGLIEIELADSTYQEICTGFNFGTVWDDARFHGLTSGDEFRENCRLQLDLDLNDDSGRLIDLVVIVSLCIDEFPIADKDVHIVAMDGFIDSLVVEVEKGIIHENQEYLNVLGNVPFTLAGQGTERLVLVNSNQLPSDSLLNAIAQIRFVIDADQPQSGERKLVTHLYKNGKASDPAMTFIQANFDARPSAGEDAFVEVCEPFKINLFEELGGEPRPFGRWEPELTDIAGPNFFSTFIDSSGTYKYILEEGGCQPDTAEVEVLVYRDPYIGLGTKESPIRDTTLCQGDSVVWDLRYPGSISYFLLPNRTTDSIQIIKEPGFYFAEARNAVGCVFGAPLSVRFREESSTQTSSQITHCSTTPLIWNGLNISRDTTICEVYNAINGCDSTHCIDFTVDQIAPQVEEASICQGRNYSYKGKLLDEPGIYFDTISLGNGCEQINQLELTVNPSYQIPIEATICPEGSFSIGRFVYDEAGDYTIRYKTAEGCDSVLNINIKVVNNVSFNQVELNTCAGDSILWGNQYYTADTSECITFTDVEGCDSIVCADIRFSTPQMQFEELNVCEDSTGLSYPYPSEGLYQDTVVLEDGCLAIRRRDFKIRPIYNIQLDTTIKENTSLMVGNFEFFEAGSYELPFQSQWGCDSLIQLNLTVEQITQTHELEIDDQYYAPNIIKQSNGDRFFLASSKGQKGVIRALTIINAQGQVVHAIRNQSVGDTANAWQASNMAEGVYFYQAIIRNEQNITHNISGQIIVLK